MKMRIWILNCPNSARIVKGTTLVVCSLTVLGLIQLIEDKPMRENAETFRQPITSLDSINQVHCVCVGFLGRLGNQIFQFASAYGIAKQKGMQVRISSRDKVANIFNISRVRIVGNKQHCGHAEKKYERFSSAYDIELLRFSTQKDILLLEYLQSWKYFANTTDDLRSELTFKEPLLDKAKTIFLDRVKSNKYFGENATYVGLHVRRGDMVIYQKKASSPYNVATRAYIINAMGYYLNNYNHVIFVICSDDLKWVKKQIGKYTKLLNMVFIDKNSPEVDLAILSQCNHTIMTTGTFSWWAAWLAGGESVYYKHYIPENSFLRKQFSADFSDYFLPGWIGME